MTSIYRVSDRGAAVRGRRSAKCPGGNWVVLALAVAGLASWAAAPAQEPQKPVSAPTAPAATGTQVTAFTPGMDDLMTMLVQPRHIKLHLAGSQMNWELAVSQQHDLRAAFRRILQYMPKYLGVDVREAMSTFMDPKLDAMDAAIATGDAGKFARAYAELTAACNSCHVYLEHGYHVIKVPGSSEASVFPDQDFAVK